MKAPCEYDPRQAKGEPIGMYHCPHCGEMVLAGQPHPDYNVEPPPPTRWQRFTDWRRGLRWRLWQRPLHKLHMSKLGRQARHQFRQECGASIMVTFGGKPHVDGQVHYRFACQLKRWHAGPCRETDLLGWTCGPTVQRPGELRYDEANRLKFDMLRRKS